jgi:hypothetical protein
VNLLGENSPKSTKGVCTAFHPKRPYIAEGRIEMLVDSVNPALVEAIPSPIKPLAVPMKKSPRRAKRCS